MDEKEKLNLIYQRLAETQGSFVIVAAQVKALKELIAILLEAKEIRLHETDSVETVIKRMEIEHIDKLLANFSDHDPDYAAFLKSYVEDKYSSD